MGMLLAVALVADDERTVFDARFFFLAWALICVGSFITPVTHRLERWMKHISGARISRHESGLTNRR
jgi:hypothetical protein